LHNRIDRAINIRISPEEHNSELIVTIPAYGEINPLPFQKRVSKAVKQLDEEAIFRSSPTMPRVVVLSIKDGIGIDWSSTIQQVQKLLSRYRKLSAIAIFRWTPEENPFENPATRWFLAFTVFHNPYIDYVSPLPIAVFDDGSSTQHSELDELLQRFQRAGL
jgi:hypothetical protein